MPYLEFFLRLGLAALLGGVVGLEREVHGRPAGIRTYLVLSLGSALLMVLSEYLLLDFPGKFPGLAVQGDPGRIAGQAITGVGFLGAGVIIRYKDSIRGLTTAACVWLVCSVGLAVGAGFYLVGLATTCLTLVALIGLKAVERRLPKDWFETLEVQAADRPDLVQQVQDLLKREGLDLVSYGLSRDTLKKELKATFHLKVRAVQPKREILQDLLQLEGVKAVQLS